MMFGDYFVFYYLRIPLVPMSQKRPDVILALYLRPIYVRIAAENSHLMLASTPHVCFTNHFV